jgi:predicted nucleotidyltransferase component of viral defense system
MMRVMPFIEKETCVALKGGTAINFFLRDMPRLSVDIDLVYLPLQPRDESLAKISEALVRIAASIQNAQKNIRVQEKRVDGGKRVAKLFVKSDGIQVKVEPNEVIRGSVFKFEERNVSPAVEENFELSATMQVLSLADIYGGKLCAALDRQHPRDMFDVKILLENEGITSEIRKAFVVYLAGHGRPMYELLDPPLKDMRKIYDQEFVGMTTVAVSYEDLVEARQQYMRLLRNGLTAEERQFLISIKVRRPDWSLLGIQGIDKLPSIQWKLANLAKMKVEKHAAYLEKLKHVLNQSV